MRLAVVVHGIYVASLARKHRRPSNVTDWNIAPRN